MRLKLTLALVLASLGTLPAAVSGYSVASSPVTVATTALADPGWVMSPARQSFYAQGRYWLFYVGARADNNRLLQYATSQDFLTWQTTNMSMTLNFGNVHFSVISNETHVFLTYVAASAGGLIFNLWKIQSGGSLTLVTNSTVVTADSVYRPSVRVSTSGQVFAIYTCSGASCPSPSGSGSNNVYVKRTNGTNYTAWVENTVLWQAPQIATAVASLAPLTEGKMYATFGTNLAGASSSGLTGRLWDNGWGANETITTTATKTAFLYSRSDTAYAIFRSGDGTQFGWATRSPAGIFTIHDNIAVPTSATSTYVSSYDSVLNLLHIFEVDINDDIMVQYSGLEASWSSGISLFTMGPFSFGNGLTSFQDSAPQDGLSSGKIGLFWTEDAGNPPYSVKASLITTVLPGPQLPPGGGGGSSLPFNATTGPVAEVILQATSFVLQWPVTSAIIIVLVLLVVAAQFQGKRRLRDLGILGIAATGANWLLGNQPGLFGILDLSSLSPYALKEPPLTLTLFGLSSSTVAFGLVMLFVSGFALIGAVGLAIRE